VQTGELLTAIITPFNKDKNIDLDAFERVIEHVIAQGSDGIIVAGTTGESPTLSSEEKKTLFSTAIEVVNKRVRIIAGAGTNDTKTSVLESISATNIGVDGIMAVTPYYNRPTQLGMYKHFQAIATCTDLPIMVYDIPSRASVALDVETIVQLSQIKNIRSLKDASGNIEATTEVIEETDPYFNVYSGDDAMTLPLLSIGATGVVSVASHVIGKQMKQMMDTFLAGDVHQAAQIHAKLSPLMNGLFKTTSPILIKEMLAQLGVATSNTRLPLVQANDAEIDLIDSLITDYNLSYA